MRVIERYVLFVSVCPANCVFSVGLEMHGGGFGVFALCVIESKNNNSLSAVLYKSRSISHSGFFSLLHTHARNQISIKTPLV